MLKFNLCKILWFQKQSDQDMEEMKCRLEAAEERLNGHLESSDVLIKSLRQQIEEHQDKHNLLSDQIEK